MNNKRIFGLFTIGIVILIAFVLFIGPEKIISALKTANLTYILLAIVIQFIILGLWNTRWSLICKSLDIPHRQLPLFAMTIIGLAINDLTPSGRSGGEPVRAYLLSKSSNESFKRTFATVMSDKIFDTFPFMVLAIFAISYLMFALHLGTAIFTVLLLSLAVFVLLLIFIVYICINQTIGLKTIEWIFSLIRRFTSKDIDKYENKARTSLIGFQSNLKLLMGNRKLLIIATVISFLVWFLELLRVYVIFLAFGVNVSLGMIASVFLVSTLIGIIPALPGGLGSIDGVMILLYSMAGITSSISTAATLVERMISLWMVLVIGVLLIPLFGSNVFDAMDLNEE